MVCIGDEYTVTPNLVHKCKRSLPKKDSERELLALSLDWSVAAGVAKIAVSDSQGCISVFHLDDTGTFTTTCCNKTSLI